MSEPALGEDVASGARSEGRVQAGVSGVSSNSGNEANHGSVRGVFLVGVDLRAEHVLLSGAQGVNPFTSAEAGVDHGVQLSIGGG